MATAVMGNGPAPTNEEKSQDTVAVAPAPEPVIKHPLNSCWCLWYFLNDKNLKWEESQFEVAKIDSVEDFWALYNHIEAASRLKGGCDYSLFREGIKPMWEDKANYNGGRWTITLGRQQRNTDLDNLWLDAIMMMVGESNDETVHNDILGSVVSVRPRGDRVALWTANSKDAELAIKVGRCLKQSLSIPPNHIIEFHLHSDTSVKRSSNVRALYTV